MCIVPFSMSCSTTRLFIWLTVFGLVGIVAGPLVVALGITLVESYRTETPCVMVPRGNQELAEVSNGKSME
jgi:hypothetical protein